MYAEIKKSHPQAVEFVNIIKEFYEGAEVREYETAFYVTTGAERVISFICEAFGSRSVVLLLKVDGELLSFPLEMFGTIYEL